MRSDKWNSLLQRLQHEASQTLANNKTDGVAIVSSHVLFTGSGEPLVWVVTSKRVEPSKDAKSILLQLLLD